MKIGQRKGAPASDLRLKHPTPTWPALALLVAFLAGCGDPVSPSYEYAVPPQTSDGWLTASLADVGMDEAPLAALMSDLRSRSNHSIHSVLVVRQGRLVLEEYFSGQELDLFAEDPLHRPDVAFGRNVLHSQASASKSVTSALVGIAINRGLIPGTDSKLFSLFPDYQALNDAQKDAIALTHLLTMTAGWPWYDDDIDAADSDETLMFFHEDPVRFVLERSLAHAPGTYMDYHSGSTVLLGEIVRRASGMDLHAFAEQYLFGPLGITGTRWAHCRNAPSVAFAGGGLYMRPRDMAKIGQLYLQDGVWNGTAVVPADWVGRSVQAAVALQDRITDHFMFTGYGLQWWVGRWDGGVDAYLAAGWGGQFIIVVPSRELVVVVTAGYFDNSMEGPAGSFIFDNIVYHSILAAIH